MVLRTSVSTKFKKRILKRKNSLKTMCPPHSGHRSKFWGWHTEADRHGPMLPHRLWQNAKEKHPIPQSRKLERPEPGRETQVGSRVGPR